MILKELPAVILCPMVRKGTRKVKSINLEASFGRNEGKGLV